MPTNKARVIKARRVLKVYRENHPDYNNHPEEPDRQALRDLMSDLMHLAKAIGEDPDTIIFTARNNYDAEKGRP